MLRLICRILSLIDISNAGRWKFKITSGHEISIPSDLQNLLGTAIAADINQYVTVRVLDVESDKAGFEPFSTIGSTTISTRIGQEKFRKLLVDYWCGGCAVTGLRLLDILKAFHIKPWSESTDAERMDKFNGLLLSPNLDALFDNGFISFSNNRKLMISDNASAYTTMLGIGNELNILYKQ